MAETPPTPPTPGCPRWIKIALAVSLALNLLVAGVLLGAALSPKRGGLSAEDRAAVRTVGILPFITALEPADRRALARALRADGFSLREGRGAVERRFEAFLGALREEPFDRATAERLIVDQRRSTETRQEASTRIFLDRLAAMSPEERRAYADRLDSSVRRGPPQR